MAKPELTPREKANKQLMANLSPKEKATYMEGVERRLKEQQAAKKAAAKEAAAKEAAAKKPATKKAKNLRQKMSDAAKKSAAQSETATRKKVEGTKKSAKKVARRTLKEAKKGVKGAKKTGAKAAVKGAVKAGSALGATKGLVKGMAPVAGKVAAPLAALKEGYELGKLFTTAGRKEAYESMEEMADDGAVSRVVQSLLNPVKANIGGAGLTALDAGLTSLGNLTTDMSETDDKIESLKEAKDAQQAALDSGLSSEEQKELRRFARQNKMKEFGDIRTPEQAREMYDTVLGSPEVIDKKIDGPTEAEPQKVAPQKVAPKAVVVEDDERRPEPSAPSRAAIMAGEEAVAPLPEVDYTDEAVSLFKTTHGTSFDPNSRMDRGKLEKMKTLLSEKGGLKDSKNEKEKVKFALDFYRRFPD